MAATGAAPAMVEEEKEPSGITIDILQQHFHQPLVAVAEELGVSLTVSCQKHHACVKKKIDCAHTRRTSRNGPRRESITHGRERCTGDKTDCVTILHT